MCHTFKHAAIGAAWVVSCLAAPVLSVETIVQPFDGVRYITRTQTVPRPLSIHILEVDLGVPGIGFRVTPANGPGVPYETTRQTTLDYLIDQGAQAAINGDFFSTYGAHADQSTMNASDGDIYSVWGTLGTRPAMNIGRDNTATVVVRDTSGSPTTPKPFVPIYNALGGDEWIVRGGAVNTSATSLAPRTATGVTADGRLLMLVVDGRRPGFSDGMSNVDVARLLISYGAVDAVNHDGGGSSTMVLADPTPRVVNRPSDGALRAVGNNLALFAAPATRQVDTAVYADFFGGDAGTFRYAPGFSGSTVGIDKNASTARTLADASARRGWSQELKLVADSAGNDDAWFVRHISGANASATENVSRPTTGSVGFWARTTTPGVSAAVAIDDAANVTADRGVWRTLVADGQWRLYEWDLENDGEWEGWINGDGVIDTATFTLDSIQFTGAGDATVYIGAVAHNALGSLTVPEPAAAGALLTALGVMALQRPKHAAIAD